MGGAHHASLRSVSGDLAIALGDLAVPADPVRVAQDVLAHLADRRHGQRLTAELVAARHLVAADVEAAMGVELRLGDSGSFLEDDDGVDALPPLLARDAG